MFSNDYYYYILMSFYSLILAFFIFFMFLLCIGVFMKKINAAKNKEYEHAVILQTATRRRLSMRDFEKKEL